MSVNNADRRSQDPKYGSWKFTEDISFKDLLTNPIWEWCIEVDKDGVPDGGTEASMRPLLNTTEVPLDHISPPLILLRIKGTDLYASGLYYREKKMLEAIWICDGNSVFHPDEMNNLTEPVIYLSVPTISGRNVAFERSKTVSDEAFQRTDL